jgi:8-oxo-dGTP diphosphatase
LGEDLQQMKKTRPIARVIIIQEEQIALLERHKQGEHYFVFPGGGIDPGETPEQAATREAHEETGLEIKLERLVAVSAFRANQELFFLAHPIGGLLGTGDGPEFTKPPSEKSGTYLACWIGLDELPHLRVLPTWIAELVVNHPNWPEKPQYFDENGQKSG